MDTKDLFQGFMGYGKSRSSGASSPAKRRGLLLSLAFFVGFSPLAQLPGLRTARGEPCLQGLTKRDAVIVAGNGGKILYQRNEKNLCIPASTLKLFTALAAIHQLGSTYRFRTEFYTDSQYNLKVKGYGDPLLISEVLKEIAGVLAPKLRTVGDLITDDSYFSRQIQIPGQGLSTNPYDAPVGAFCANFNTVFFKRDRKGRILSAEPQTPLIGFAKRKVSRLQEKSGRYTFSHNQHDAARYAGELLAYFLRKKGVKMGGAVVPGRVAPSDRRILTYRSRFTLKKAIGKMLEFSNNFMANQIFLSLGAARYGPPGTLEKAVRVASGFAEKELGLQRARIVEGSGISRENRLSATDMLKILTKFRPYRHLLKRKGDMFYKSGTLRGIRTRAGYVETRSGDLYMFAVFLNRSHVDIHRMMRCLGEMIERSARQPRRE